MTKNATMEELNFLTETEVRRIAEEFGTPTYVYSRSELMGAVDEVLSAFKIVPYGLNVRFAMKANSHPEVLKLFDEQNIEIDASSEFEAQAAIDAGIDPQKILLTAQQLPRDIKWIGDSGVHFTATSLHQLRRYGEAYPNSKVSIRLNTGLGSGANHRLTTGGIEVGFGIWFHSDSDNRDHQIHEIAKKFGLEIERVHIHIGTGSDPAIWEQLMIAGIKALDHFPDATVLNLGGGFKVAYMNGDHQADLTAIGNVAAKHLNDFEAATGRKIKLEVEPGRYLTARAGSLISTIIDHSDTGERGDEFLKLDSGMTEFARTAMYGSQHPLVVVHRRPNRTQEEAKYVVIGHCCESSDLFTSKRNDPETIEPRPLLNARIGDYMVLEMAGAYCASMSMKGYNSFPLAKELMID
ncbi:MAG: hypothetical protein R3313_03845 [Candidatus Saccharimonadales bacterium]|nr:hypothetical protein [Candidatus Saccharimonadales bacterium]